MTKATVGRQDHQGSGTLQCIPSFVGPDRYWLNVGVVLKVLVGTPVIMAQWEMENVYVLLSDLLSVYYR